MKRTLHRVHTKSRAIFSAFLITVISSSASAQLINSLNVSTGWDNTTMTNVAFNVQDPVWRLVNGTNPPFTLGTIPYFAWVSQNSWLAPEPGSEWISYQPGANGAGRMTSAGAEVDNIGGQLVFERTFETCVEDKFRISGTGRVDNIITSITVDGTVVPVTGPAWGFTLAPTGFIGLPPGVHTIQLVVDNLTGGTALNPCGISLSATIASSTGINSIIDSENFPAYRCGDTIPCEPPCNDCHDVNFVPKVSNIDGDLTCSQIFDDGTSVGVGTTGPFNYTGGGVMTAGAPGPQLVKLDVNGLTRTTTLVVTSDKKFKKDITTLENSLEKVLKLRPVEYNWKVDQYRHKGFDHLKHSGFIAQELAEVLPNTVIKDEAGDYAVEYLAIIPVLTQAIQEQQKMINELKDEVARLKGEPTSATDMMNPASGSILEQNVPNPFTAQTVIKYNIASIKTDAYIAVYTIKGELLSRHDIRQAGKGSVTINGGELAAGMYMYKLYVDGKEVDTKKMVLTK